MIVGRIIACFDELSRKDIGLASAGVTCCPSLLHSAQLPLSHAGESARIWRCPDPSRFSCMVKLDMYLIYRRKSIHYVDFFISGKN